MVFKSFVQATKGSSASSSKCLHSSSVIITICGRDNRRKRHKDTLNLFVLRAWHQLLNQRDPLPKGTVLTGPRPQLRFLNQEPHFFFFFYKNRTNFNLLVHWNGHWLGYSVVKNLLHICIFIKLTHFKLPV